MINFDHNDEDNDGDNDAFKCAWWGAWLEAEEKDKGPANAMMTWLLVVVMKMSIYVGSIYSGTYHNFMRLLAT